MGLILFKKPMVSWISLSLLFFGLFFQNCGPSYLIDVSSDTGAKMSGNGSGNGEGYTGKPGRFVQIVPDFKCEDTASVAAEIRVQGQNNIELIRHRNDKCNVAIENLNRVDSSFYNPDLIGYREGIFERLEQESPNPQLDTYTEAWCSTEANSADPYDVVVQFNSQRQVAKFRYYFLDSIGQYQMSSMNSVDSRILDPNFVNYEATGFNLSIDRSKPASSAWWFFPAKFSGTVNGIEHHDTLTCRVATGKLLGTLQKLYPHSGQWNQYVKKTITSTDEFSQPDVACDIASITKEPKLTRADCIHGGEKLVVATDMQACNDLQISDQLKAFEWVCVMREGRAHFVSTRLRGQMGLKDLLQSDATNNVSWRPEMIQITRSGQLIYESEPQVWWDNPVSILPDSTQTAVTLTNLDPIQTQIFVLAKTAKSLGYIVGSDHIALVSLPGAKLIADHAITNPCLLLNQIGIWTTTDPTCLIRAREKNFLWYELDIDGENTDALNSNPSTPDILLLVTESKFTRLNKAHLVNNITTKVGSGYGIFLWLTENLYLSNMSLSNFYYPIAAYMANNHTLYSEITVTDSAGSFFINGWNWYNVLKNVEVKNTGGGLGIVMSPETIVAGASLNQNTDGGFFFNSAGAGFEALFNIIYSGPPVQIDKTFNNQEGLVADVITQTAGSNFGQLTNTQINIDRSNPCDGIAQDFILTTGHLPMLRLALEILGDGRGNENALCEPTEACEYQTRVGANITYYDPDNTLACEIKTGIFAGTQIRGIASN